jgi:hypothetical protein
VPRAIKPDLRFDSRRLKDHPRGVGIEIALALSPNLRNGRKLQQVEMHLGPLLSIGRDDARQRAGHHILGRCQA